MRADEGVAGNEWRQGGGGGEVKEVVVSRGRKGGGRE